MRLLAKWLQIHLHEHFKNAKVIVEMAPKQLTKEETLLSSLSSLSVTENDWTKLVHDIFFQRIDKPVQ